MLHTSQSSPPVSYQSRILLFLCSTFSFSSLMMRRLHQTIPDTADLSTLYGISTDTRTIDCGRNKLLFLFLLSSLLLSSLKSCTMLILTCTALPSPPPFPLLLPLPLQGPLPCPVRSTIFTIIILLRDVRLITHSLTRSH